MAMLDDIKKLIFDLRNDIEDMINRKVMSAKQVRVQTGLSDISERLGLITAGEFRTGNNKEPGFGFSGVRMGYPGFEYSDDTWNVVGVNGDRMQFGLNANTGEASFGGGKVTLNQDGMVSTVYSKIVSLDVGGLGNNSHWLGGLNAKFGIHAADNGTSLISEDFESGTLSAWTSIGFPVIYEESASTDGTYSAKLTDTNYITKVVSLTSGDTVQIKVRARYLSTTSSTPSMMFGATNVSVYSPAGNVTLTDSWQEFVLIGVASSTGNSTVSFKSGNDSTVILVDDIEVSHDVSFASVGMPLDGVGGLNIETTGTIFINVNNTRILTMGATANTGFVISVKAALADQAGLVDEIYAYNKNGKFILRFQDGGTTRYKYLDMTGTGTTWVHSTTEP